MDQVEAMGPDILYDAALACRCAGFGFAILLAALGSCAGFLLWTNRIREVSLDSVRAFFVRWNVICGLVVGMDLVDGWMNFINLTCC